MKSTIRCLVHPTEDIQRIEEAIKNILGQITLSRIEMDEYTEMNSTIKKKMSFQILRQSIHDKRIIDAVRVRLLKNLDEFTTYVFFGKQAAYVGKLRLIDNNYEDPPLGAIEIRFDFKTNSEFEEFLDWFSPRTKKGRIVS